MKHSKNKRAIIVLGPPGSGKGTQAELLAEKFNLFHLETSEIIERKLVGIQEDDSVVVKGEKYFLIEEKRKRESGKLMSGPLIGFWMTEKIKELAEERKGIVTSGSPRTLDEAKDIIPSFKKLYGVKNIKIIWLKLGAEDVIWRNSHRKTCELMRHPILFTKETSKLRKCPFDGSKLLIRKDDTPEAIKVRLERYEVETLPVVDYLKKEGLKIKNINGSPPPAEVFASILKALNFK